VRRLLTLIAVLMALLTGSLSTISAQEQASPTPADDSGAVTIYGSDGQPVGDVVVDAFVDPFEEYDPSSGPQRGFHFVMASVTVNATEGTVEANAYGFSLVDSDGFLYTATYVYRPTESTEAMPDFPGGTLEAGQSMSGVVFFEVLEGTSPAYLIYQPTYETLVTVADMRKETVAEGDSVEFLASDGQPGATLSVDGVINPLEDYDPGYAPQRGFEYVAVKVTIENSGSKPFEVDPYDFVLVDGQGFLNFSYGAYRTPEAEAETPSLQYNAELPAGESVTGLVIYQALAGTEPGMIYYSPSSDRQIRLAEYGEDRAPVPSGTPVSNLPNNGSDETPEADKTPVTTSSADCEGVIEWAEASVDNVTDWSNAFEAVAPAFSGEAVDPDAVRDAADKVDQAASDQEDLDAPEIAEDANDALVAVFQQSADILREIADAAEAGDDAAVSENVQKLFEVGTAEGTSLDETFTALSEACPEVENVGDE
jgi:hypothetical protein